MHERQLQRKTASRKEINVSVIDLVVAHCFSSCCEIPTEQQRIREALGIFRKIYLYYIINTIREIPVIIVIIRRIPIIILAVRGIA